MKRGRNEEEEEEERKGSIIRLILFETEIKDHFVGRVIFLVH